MPFRVFIVGPCFALIAIGLMGCGGSTGSTVQGRVSPPSITTQPASQTVTAGHRAIFTVGGTGTLPFGYQWQEKSTKNTGGTSPHSTTPPTSTPDNNPTFDVVGSNAAGSV